MLGEDQGIGFLLAVIQAPWVGQWQCPICHEVSYHLSLNNMMQEGIQLKLGQLRCLLSNVSCCIGVVEHGLQWVQSHHRNLVSLEVMA
jgi:hypothetical protein